MFGGTLVSSLYAALRQRSVTFWEHGKRLAEHVYHFHKNSQNCHFSRLVVFVESPIF